MSTNFTTQELELIVDVIQQEGLRYGSVGTSSNREARLVLYSSNDPGEFWTNLKEGLLSAFGKAKTKAQSMAMHAAIDLIVRKIGSMTEEQVGKFLEGILHRFTKNG